MLNKWFKASKLTLNSDEKIYEICYYTKKNFNIGCDKTTGVGTTKFLDLQTVTETGKHMLNIL
jgi:hypothetical protein